MVLEWTKDGVSGVITVPRLEHDPVFVGGITASMVAAGYEVNPPDLERFSRNLVNGGVIP